MAGSNIGDAIFSTDLGRWAPRDPAIMPPRIILRSDPTEDMEAMIAELQAKYPAQCKAMKAPITNIHDYYDTYDQQLHGQMFLHTVLMEICLQNTLRKNAILDYSEAWSRLNSEAFECIHQFELDAFTDDDLEEYGEDFLREVLQLLQVRKTKQDEAGACMQTQDRYQQANTRPFAVFPPQDHEFARPTQRNSSAPTSSHISFAQPRLTPSLPSSTPGLAQVFIPTPPIPPPLQRSENANTRPVEPPLRSAPLYYSRRGEHYSDPIDSGINIPRPGFSDTIVAVPPPGSMPGPFSFHRVPAGPRAFHYPAKKSRTLPRSRAPVYVGPSNDARVLEKQGVSRHRSSFGEGRVNRIIPQSYAQQGSYSKAYALSQQNQSFGVSPERPPPGTKYPFPGSNNVASRGMPTESNPAPYPTEEGSFRMSQHASFSSNFDRLNGFSDRDHAIQYYPFTRHGHRQDTSHESQYAERDGFPDLTPPNRAQRLPKVSQTNSPTAHRFRSASMRPSETTPRTHDPEEHQYAPDSRAHRSDRNSAVSDRKVWIGGLMPDTDVTILSRLLEPWGPVSISRILISKTKGRPYPSHNGFSFAEFDMPHRAADAIKALNEQYVDHFQYKIFLKPAHIRPPFDLDDGSPKKTGPRANRRSDHQGSFDRNNEELMPAVPTSFEADAQAPSSLPLEQPDRTLQKRDQFSAEWPALGTNTSQPGQTSQSPEGVQSHISQDTPKQRASLQVSDPGGLEIAEDHKLGDSRGNAATRVASSSTKAAESNVSSHKSKTPSPKKKNNRNAIKDASTDGKIAQAKQRKEMLSSLRTEKLNAAASSSVPPTPILGNDQQVRNYNGTSSVNDGKKSSGNEGTVAESPLIPPSTLENNAEIAVTAHSELCEVQVSPVHSASTHERRQSSASMVVSTDPTSYAQSESSETGTIDFQTSTYQDHDGSSRSIQIAPTGHVDVSKLDRMLGDAVATELPGRDQPPDAGGRSAVQPSKDRSSPATSVPGPDVTSTEFSPPDEKIVTNDEQDISLTISAELSSSEKPEAVAVTPPELDIETPGQNAETEQTHNIIQSGTPARQPNQDSVPMNTPADDLATPPRYTPLETLTQRSLNQPPHAQQHDATSPPLKRGPLKDPKILVAVPKILPLMRNKPRSRETCIQGSKTATQSTEKSANEARDSDAEKAPVCGKPQSGLDALSASSTTAEKGQSPKFPTTPRLEGVPVALFDPEQPSHETIGVDNVCNDTDGASKLTSVSCSIATIEDDRLDPDTSTPQSFAAAILDLAKDVSEMPPSEQQPAVQQKKPKTKKGKKKAKKSKTSQTDSADGNQKSQSESSAVQTNQAKNVVQVETPFLSDDKQPLPRPTFAIQNHSSMRSRNGQWLRNQSLSTSKTPTVEKKDEESYILLLVNSIKETGEQDSTPTRTEPQVSGNVQTQTAGTETHEVGVQPEDQEPPNMVDEATRETRAKELDDYLEKNKKAPRHQLLGMLDLLSLHQRAGKSEGPSELPKAAFNDVREMNGPRVEEITSGDEAQPVSPPMAPLKQREQRMLPSRDASPAGVITGDPSQVTKEPHGTNEVQREGGISVSTNHVTASFPSTRRTSPERGRFRSVSPAKGLGLSIVRPSSNNVENMSPSRQPRKILSYKQVASTPSFQPGEILEIISKQSNQEGKEGQGVTMVRKAGSKDPWRVPSSEQPWGGNNKAKGGPSTEASEGAK